MDPDTPLTVPLLIDSSSAIAILQADHENVGSRHIARRFFAVRSAILEGRVHPTKILGTYNVADVGTKNLDALVVDQHRRVLQTRAA